MLELLRGKVSDRKLRLFAVACCRLVGELLTDEAREAVAAAERFADGRASAEELARLRALTLTRRQGQGDVGVAAGYAARAAFHAAAAWGAERDASHQCAEVTRCAQAAASRAARGSYGGQGATTGPARASVLRTIGEGARLTQRDQQRALLRDVVGNPFRPAAVPAAWRDWNAGAVVHLAQAIYEERRFGDLPVLADALEDAGCTDAEVLGHCRRLGEHTRGCWVVDALLGLA
jgi:hypothetical protein